MELWIRSQDKKRLVKVFDIYIGGTYGNEIIAKYAGYNSGCSYTNLGEYKTKGRALEVLDEIQELIKPKIITTQYQCAIEDNKKTEFNLIMNPVKTEIQELSTIVYEIPKE